MESRIINPHNFRGQPLADAWLNGLLIRYADGTTARISGIVCLPNESLVDVVKRFCKEKNCSIECDDSFGPI